MLHTVLHRTGVTRKVCVWGRLVPVCALTVHSHGRSQRVSLRGVSSVLPFFWRVDQIKAPMGRDARRCASMDELLSTVSQTDWKRDHTRSLPYTSRPFVVWDAGTRPMEAAPAESPPPSSSSSSSSSSPDRRETKGHNALDVTGSRLDNKTYIGSSQQLILFASVCGVNYICEII